VIRKVSFYGYLFGNPFDTILRYDILWKDSDKYLLKYTQLDREYKNQSQHISVTVHDSIAQAIGAVILRLRNKEVENRVYEDLTVTDRLSKLYEPFIDELEQAMVINHVATFSLFGNVCKYKPQTAARNFLKSMGYFILTTKRPHVYILDEFIRQEQEHIYH
jgi:hypothetical protein